MLPPCQCLFLLPMQNPAGKSTGLPCSWSAACPPPLSHRSCAAALHNGAKCFKSHLLCICHPRMAHCPWQGGKPAQADRSHCVCATRAGQGGSAAHGAACMPAELSAPLAHTTHWKLSHTVESKSRVAAAGAEWHLLQNNLQSSTGPRMWDALQSKILPALPPSPPPAWALVEQP